MIYSIETAVESFHVLQKYSATKPLVPMSGVTWHYHTGYRDGPVPLVRKENGAMKSSMATWGVSHLSGEDKYVGFGWPAQPGFIPATSFMMEVPNTLHPWAPLRYRISRPDSVWFMITAGWHGAPALDERECKVSVTSGSSLPHGLPYQPIMFTADEWARGLFSGSMSLASMRIDPL